MSNADRRRVPRSDAPVSSTGVMAIVVSVIAVVAGFYVLRTINTETDSVTSLGNGSASDVGDRAGAGVVAISGTSLAPGTATTAPITADPVAVNFSGATIVVANANGTKGSAGDATKVLSQSTDFQMGTPLDAVADVDKSVVYFDAAKAAINEPVAKTLARVLGNLEFLAMPNAKVVDGDLGDAGVVLMLGKDLKAMSISDLQPPLKATGAATPTSAAGTAASSTPTSAAAS